MPIGPNGEKRPQSTHSAAIMVAKIATGEIEEEHEPGHESGSKEGPLKKPVFLRVTKTVQTDRAGQSTRSVRFQRAK